MDWHLLMGLLIELQWGKGGISSSTKESPQVGKGKGGEVKKGEDTMSISIYCKTGKN